MKAKIYRHPSVQFDYNVKGVEYEAYSVMTGEVVRYTGKGEREGITLNLRLPIVIREKEEEGDETSN